MSSTAAVRSALRRLVRAKNYAFKGDSTLLAAANETLRRELSQTPDGDRSVDAGKRDGDRSASLVQELDIATTFLKTNIVQAPLNERGNYSVDAKDINETAATAAASSSRRRG